LKIKIRNDLYPYSLSFNNDILLTNTNYILKVFPALLIFKELSSHLEFKIELDIKGPVKNFQVVQDLKRGYVKVSFLSLDDFISFKILTLEQASIVFDKIKSNKLNIKINNKSFIASSKEIIDLPIKTVSNLLPNEKISFGNHKKQQIDQINQRNDLLEFIPIIFALSQFFEIKKNYDISFFKELEKKIDKNQKDNLEEDFLNIKKSYFYDFLAPRNFDFDYQNIFFEDLQNVDPIFILIEYARLIRKTLIFEDKNNLNILPCLLKDFFCGRMINIHLSFGILEIEWSKKLIKKMILKPSIDKNITFNFQKKIKSYRLRCFLKEKGEVFENNQKILLEKNKIYYFDRFQK
jgi:hypothetical protein